MKEDKQEGVLFYNFNNDRMGISFKDDSIESGLHCGQTREVKINGKWVPTRIEMSDHWYLVGIKNIESIEGLIVRL